MAFLTTNEGVPYYKPVAPEVPSPSDTAARILSSSAGVAGFVQMALAKERSQIDREQMVANADLQARRLAFEREDMADRHGLETRRLDIQENNNNLNNWYEGERLKLEQDLAPSRKSLLESQAKYNQTQADLYGSALTSQIDNANKKAEFLLQAKKDADELHLDDPQFQNNNPMQYAKNALGFERLYGSSIDDVVQGAVKKYKDNAEKSKVKLADRMYPWSQIVQDIDRNGGDSAFIPMLTNAGFFDVKKTEANVPTGEKRFGIPVYGTQTTTTRTPKAPLSGFLTDETKGTPLKDIDKFTAKASPFEQAASNIQNKPIPGTRGRVTPASVAEQAGGYKGGNTNAATPPPMRPQEEIDADYINEQIKNNPSERDYWRGMFLKNYPNSTLVP